MSRDILGALGWLLLVFLAAWVGSRFLPDDWYRGINKPDGILPIGSLRPFGRSSTCSWPSQPGLCGGNSASKAPPFP